VDVAVRSGRIVGRLRLPGSKYVAQRAILLASHRGGTVTNVPENDDMDRLCEGLRRLGYRVDEEPGTRRIAGSLGASDARLDMGDNATGARFLMALAALRDARTVIDGSPRLCQRPMRPLCEALRRLGVTVEGNRLPVALRGPIRGSEIFLESDASSQFASALILIVDRAPGLRVQVHGRESISYVGLTAHVQRTFRSPYRVEPDYGAAAPFAAAAAASGGDLLLEELGWSSPQPDARFFWILRLLGAEVSQTDGGIRIRGGALRGCTLDLSLCPDLGPVLGVLGALAEGATVVWGAPHLAFKESDRIRTTTALVRALGGEAEAREDGFVVEGGRPLHGTPVSAEGDHRIAMAAAVAGTCIPGVVVEGAEAVAKSYPGFFEDLDAVTS
jgi:3-phosphoshikimate 1-carboxyvinyltransferase